MSKHKPLTFTLHFLGGKTLDMPACDIISIKPNDTSIKVHYQVRDKNGDVYTDTYAYCLEITQKQPD